MSYLRAARRLTVVFFVTTLAAAVSLGSATAEVKKRPDGLHYADWVKNLSFLDLADDLAEAKAEGRGLVILFEAPGCGSCKKLHEINFQNAELVAYIREHFDVVQINTFGDKTAHGVDSQPTDEKELAQTYMVHFTPTTLFVDASGKEVFRVAGFIPAKFYRDAFEYVVDRGYERGLLFPRWRQEKAQEKAKKAKGDGTS
jgi:thioredoxin-related protein